MTPTLDEVRAAFKRHSGANGRKATRKLLEKCGATCVGNLAPDSYAAFIASTDSTTMNARAWVAWNRKQ